MKKLAPHIIFFCLCAYVIFSCKSPRTRNLPNIVFILADDLGYADLGCYGQKILKTPQLDQLAREGIRFTQFYAGSTVCAPSRASLLTGKHTGHTSVRANTLGQLLIEEEETLAEILKGIGYQTAVMGKWGVGHQPGANDPKKNGFDQSFGYINMWHAHNFYPEFLYKNGKKERLRGNKLQVGANGQALWSDRPEGTGVAEVRQEYAPDLFLSASKQFIHGNKDRPFFLFLSLNLPHANNEAGKKGMEVPNVSEFADQDWPEPEKGFATMVQHIDTSVGEILQLLDSLGLTEETLVIFTSDNGPHQEGGHQAAFFDSNGPLRGKKRDLYEGGIRVPFIAKWPGTIPPGIQTDHIAAFWDILPTFCDITRILPPKKIDGISFLSTLKGKANKQKEHPYLYWEFYEQGGKQAVRHGNWKAIKLNVRDPEKEIRFELYDLEKDPKEQNNLALDSTHIEIRMKEIMRNAHKPLPGFSLFSLD